MSEIIILRRSSLVPWREIEGYFRNNDWHYPGDLAELLLENESTAVYHIDPSRVDFMGRTERLLLGVNYHYGHSEAQYTIAVQNIPERRGQWVLFRPPGSEESTFYLDRVGAHMRCYGPQFEDEVVNLGKIEHMFLYRGDPLQIFVDFQAKGFSFVDTPMPDARYEELSALSRAPRQKE